MLQLSNKCLEPCAIDVQIRHLKLNEIGSFYRYPTFGDEKSFKIKKEPKGKVILKITSIYPEVDCSMISFPFVLHGA
jgi:hypothetical protein